MTTQSQPRARQMSAAGLVQQAAVHARNCCFLHTSIMKAGAQSGDKREVPIRRHVQAAIQACNARVQLCNSGRRAAGIHVMKVRCVLQ